MFAREGIPGCIFLEGNLSKVTRAVRNLGTAVFVNVTLCLLPLEQCIALLLPHNLLSRPIKEGQWVCCSHKLYCNDIGFVCGHDPFWDAETTMALVPQIPNKMPRTAKRKRVARPEPRSWSVEQLEASWGQAQVRRVSPEECIFRHQTYKSGLLSKQLPPVSLVNVDGMPDDLHPFLRATFICNNPSFAPWIHRFAQDRIQPGQWVKVEAGDHKGAIGKPIDVVDSVACVLLNDMGDGPTLQIELHALAPFYNRGHHVKSRWSESAGIVMSTDEVQNTVTYVERDSQKLVSTITR
jgi:hypothetical protein